MIWNTKGMDRMSGEDVFANSAKKRFLHPSHSPRLLLRPGGCQVSQGSEVRDGLICSLALLHKAHRTF